MRLWQFERRRFRSDPAVGDDSVMHCRYRFETIASLTL
jgi:hypothetical protein